MKFLTRTTLLIGMLLSVIPLAQAQTPADPDKEYDQHLIQEMDNMLNLWYVQREMANSKSVLSKLKDADNNAVVHTDSVVAMRVRKIATSLPIAYNEYVKPYIDLYVIKRQRSSAALLGLAQYYYPIMQEIFDKYSIPEELIYLTIIESGLNPTAVSKAGATGIWQFMYTTGKMYGLDVNSFIDDRRNPVKATDAAARHLRDLYNMFNDWGLAISAYNCGPGNVRKAIARSGNKNDFWGIRPFLPKETQNYFPAFIGAFYMMKYHELYGIKAANISIPGDVDTVMVFHELHLEQIAHILNINIDELRTLNPQYKRDIVPAYVDSFPLKLRNRDVVRFIDLQDSAYAYNRDAYFLPVKAYESSFTGNSDGGGGATTLQKIYHTVKNGETIAKVAAKYGIAVAELKRMNKLKTNTIAPKQRLIVGYKTVAAAKPATAKDSTTAAKSAPTSTQTTTTKPATNNNNAASPIIHIVKKGETLSIIAAKYNVDVKKIAAYNNLTNFNSLVIGQHLKIPKK